ncbi:MAG: PD-(D/E)XK nuclease family protein [Bacteroidota bacterium]
MQTFLDQVVLQLRDRFDTGISDFALIVPTRRAVAFLRQAVQKAYPQTLWAPKICSIQDFVRETAGGQFPELLTLVFELYQCYAPMMSEASGLPRESLEAFFPWGEMLIKDFDEVDKYCVPAQSLFTNVKDLKEIDAFFALPDLDPAPVRRFWQTLRGQDREPEGVQARFLRIWQSLFPLYTAYRQRLRERNMGYEGMAYRDLAEKLPLGEINFPYEKIVFIGFNALSRAEEQIMHHLLREQQALVFWDADSSYLIPGGKQKRGYRRYLAGGEPGKFIREYHQKWSNYESHLILHHMRQEPKAITYTGVARSVGQTRLAGHLLQELQLEPEDLPQTVVVLADENLLFPLLHTLPSSANELNITMGFPLRQTDLYHLLEALMRVLRSLTWDLQGTAVVGHAPLADLLNNPFLRGIDPELTQKILEEVTKRNLVFVPVNWLQDEWKNSQIHRHLMAIPVPAKPAGGHRIMADLPALLRYLQGLFETLITVAQEQDARLEAEYAFQFFRQYNLLHDILQRYKPGLSLEGFTRLFRDMMRQVRIPFEGEPLSGLQIMGFLETRVIDFKHVIILGANEGMLPDTSTGNSFIPFNLRKGFGLPTYEERDAIYAYHFYRLIQRTETLHLCYNTIHDDTSVSHEKSRFMLQIAHFFTEEQAPQFKMVEQVMTTPAPFTPVPSLQIDQTTDTQSRFIHRYTAPGQNSYLSASALNRYVGCSLRFYFQDILRLREIETVEESLEAGTFGQILHKTMEELYTPFIGQEMDAGKVEIARKGLKIALGKAFADSHMGRADQLQGRNKLLGEAIERLCARILDQDAAGPNFIVESLEAERSLAATIAVDGKSYRLNGTLDRVDYVPSTDTWRILDYKTGRVEIKKGADVESCLNDYSQKETLQGYLYAWLYRHYHPERKVQVGYITARDFSQGIVYLQEGGIIQPEHLDGFEKGLKDLIRRMQVDPFVQTKDQDKLCVYCAYNRICGREG